MMHGQTNIKPINS